MIQQYFALIFSHEIIQSDFIHHPNLLVRRAPFPNDYTFLKKRMQTVNYFSIRCIQDEKQLGDKRRYTLQCSLPIRVEHSRVNFEDLNKK